MVFVNDELSRLVKYSDIELCVKKVVKNLVDDLRDSGYIFHRSEILFQIKKYVDKKHLFSFIDFAKRIGLFDVKVRSGTSVFNDVGVYQKTETSEFYKHGFNEHSGVSNTGVNQVDISGKQITIRGCKVRKRLIINLERLRDLSNGISDQK